LEIFVIKASHRLAPSPYHHGNLAPALVEAALALLDDTQDWAFSLREVARRAGVSHNAPYKHFPEKRDLLAAVAARGFEALTERTLSSLEGLTEARARLLACGRAFVAHGIANPALYRLMFSAVLTSSDAGRPPIEKAAAAKARAIVDATLADAVQSGVFPSSMANPRQGAAASLAMWSLLHGLTMLAIDDFVGPPKDVETLVDPILGALLDGIASHPPALTANIWMAPRL
jgi:AcrR family transcriptional regulator